MCLCAHVLIFVCTCVILCLVFMCGLKHNSVCVCVRVCARVCEEYAIQQARRRELY